MGQSARASGKRGAGTSGAAVGIACAVLLIGCAETKPPYRPRPNMMSSTDDAGGGEPGIDAGEGNTARPPTQPRRPSGAELEEMIEHLRTVGADYDDPDRICIGGGQACGIDPDGEVHCWGNDSSGEASPPQLQSPAVQVACGINFSCALDEAGKITCWGAGEDATQLDVANQGQSVPPSGTFKRIAIGSYGFHGCAIDRSDNVQCWGGGAADKPEDAHGNFHQARPLAGTFERIAVGEAHTCGIRTDGTVSCWGAIGDRCFPQFSYACGQTEAPMGTFVDIAAGEFHTCALREDGTATCWGRGLADSPCVPDSGAGEFDCGQGMVPDDVEAPFISIRSGNLHTCAVTEDYDVVCWGWNENGQTEVPPLYAFSQVAGGDRGTCGVTSALTVECWGGYPMPVPDALR